jgi:hypothetical protein
MGQKGGPMTSRQWWEKPGLLLAITLLAALPLLWPTTPPLVDVPGHIGRYRVELDLAVSPTLQKYFDFKWALVGNLGVDLLIVPLRAIFGLETGVKIAVILIPVLTTLGLLLTAREVHGRIPASAYFAVPFVYGYPFNFGFINFSLSMAFALLAFALWLRVRAKSRLTRALIFVPVSCLIWLTHAFGWGALGLLVWSAELIREHDLGRTWFASAGGAMVEAILLAFPIVLMIAWRSAGAAGATYGYLGIESKIFSIAAAMRDRWLLWDTFGVTVAVVLIGAAKFDRQLEFSRRLMIPAATLFAAFILMPTQVFGSAYADMRLAPYMLMLGVLSVRFQNPKLSSGAGLLASLGLLFVVARLLGNTISFALGDHEIQSDLAALSYVPKGAAVLSIIGNDCNEDWRMPIHSHLGSFVITRRDGFSNDQWQLPGAQLLRVHYPAARDFAADPSETVFTRECLTKTAKVLEPGQRLGRSLDQALNEFPRGAFDYVWLIKPVDWDDHVPPGLTKVWSNSESSLYRVAH